ncbi:hypothetical protein [Candidatus Amarobacter glycogenicus]|uniref:hypothetical protein n=1 Tax=Candidatus Amarobacter glycogenicus TaxID=3140699 RepID=UPI0031CC6549
MTTNIERQPAYPALRPGNRPPALRRTVNSRPSCPTALRPSGAPCSDRSPAWAWQLLAWPSAWATGLAADTSRTGTWSRAAGFVAYLLLWGSVVWGMLLSSKIGKGKLRPPVLLDAHQFLSHVAVGFTLFHGLILMGDRYLSFPCGRC